MKNTLERLDRIRERDKEVSIAANILSSLLILFLAVIVGAVVLAIQYFAGNSTVWWQDIFKDVGIDQVFKHFPFWFLLGLAVAVNSSRPIKAAINEFIFFLGVIIGFNILPKVLSDVQKPDNMGTWYLVMVVSAVLAMVFWYAKSNSWPSIAFDALIIGGLAAYCFDCGFVYFHFNDIIMDLVNAVIIALTVVALGSGVIQVCVSLIVGVVIALALGPVI